MTQTRGIGGLGVAFLGENVLQAGREVICDGGFIFENRVSFGWVVFFFLLFCNALI